MPTTSFPYKVEDVVKRTQQLGLLLAAARGLEHSLVKVKSAIKVAKHPNLFRVGAALVLLPEPVTTLVGLPIVAYSLSQRNSLRLGDLLAQSYSELWGTLSFP